MNILHQQLLHSINNYKQAETMYPKYTRVKINSKSGFHKFLDLNTMLILDPQLALNRSSHHTPAGGLMLCASSIDSMFKEKRYTEGCLYNRNKSTVAKDILTPDVAKWANEVTLDASHQSHADGPAALPIQNDTKRALDFVKPIAQYFFVLPAEFQRGREAEGGGPKSSNVVPRYVFIMICQILAFSSKSGDP